MVIGGQSEQPASSYNSHGIGLNIFEEKFGLRSHRRRHDREDLYRSAH